MSETLIGRTLHIGQSSAGPFLHLEKKHIEAKIAKSTRLDLSRDRAPVVTSCNDGDNEFVAPIDLYVHTQKEKCHHNSGRSRGAEPQLL